MPLYIADLGTTGLSDVGYQFLDSTGAGIGSRTTTGVSEIVAGKGVYGVEVSTPATAQAIYWNSSGTASAYAIGGADTRNDELNDLDAAGIRTAVGMASADLDTQLDAIVADTNEIQTDLADGGRLDLLIDAIKAVTDQIPDGGALTSLLADISAILTDTGTTLDGKLDAIAGYIDTEVAAIKAVTDAIPDGGALTSLLADISAILTDTSTTLDGKLDAIQGATFDTATDSLEAIRDRGDAAWITGSGGDATEAKQDTIIAALGVVDGIVDDILVDTGTTLPAAIAGIDAGSGSGAYGITVTVTDGTDPLENATVRVIEGANNFQASTNANGEASFSLDAATYSVRVTKDGYSFTPATRTVTGEESGTLTNDLAMTAISLPGEPDAADLCRVTGYVETLEGAVASGVEIEFALMVPRADSKSPNPAKSTKLVKQSTLIVTTDAQGRLANSDGDAWVDLQRTDELTPAGCVYHVRSRALGIDPYKEITLTASTADFVALIRPDE